MVNLKKIRRKMEAKINEINERLLIDGLQEPPPAQPTAGHPSAPKLPTIFDRVAALEDAVIEIAGMVVAGDS